LLGAATIRAHRIIPATLAALEQHVQMNNYTLSFKTGAVNYFTIRLQAMGSFFCMLLALLALSLRAAHSGNVLFWAAIPICLSMTSSFRALVRLICAADANMQSIETIVDFYSIPHELDADDGDDTITERTWHGRQVSTASVSGGSTRPVSQYSSSSTTSTDSRSLSTSRHVSSLAFVRMSAKPFWPDKGSVKVSGLTVGYGGAPVLHDLSFTIKPMQKVAVVGRTGVGKSTLLATFFGAADVLSGSIVIDGKDVGTVPVRRLRSSLSLIPQTAVVFSLSIRENLDIHGEHSDVRLWDVLDQVGLGDMIRNLPGGLAYSFRTGAGADLWSTGQKQLLCIARTLLRPSRVIFLDEATSSVDDESDSKIMRVIDDCFAHCTVIACVHRLNNIMMFDRVLVLDKGRMVEFDKPQTLINKEGGVLRELWQAQHRP
jgi:ABC-type multidrug transport system fused ATPase/permease subunit